LETGRRELRVAGRVVSTLYDVDDPSPSDVDVDDELVELDELRLAS